MHYSAHAVTFKTRSTSTYNITEKCNLKNLKVDRCKNKQKHFLKQSKSMKKIKNCVDYI